MKTQHLAVSRVLDARADEIWPLIADVTAWAEWGPFDIAELEKPGRNDPNGAGAIRRLTRGKRVTRERIIAFDPEFRLSYVLLSGIPVRDYVADIVLTPKDSGTEVSWEAIFEAARPFTGGVIHLGLSVFMARLLRKLEAAVIENRSRAALEMLREGARAGGVGLEKVRHSAA